MRDFIESERSMPRCLWLTRIDPEPLDAGDSTYTFHLISSLSRAGARLTVLATQRTGDRTRNKGNNGIEWVEVHSQRDRDIGGRVAARSLFSRLPNVASQYNTASFRRALRVQMVRDWDAIIVDHLGMGWAWPAVEIYQRRKADVISVFIAHNCEGDVRRNMARNFRGDIARKIGLTIDAGKAAHLEKKLVRHSILVSAITAEDVRSFGGLEKIVLLTPGYAGLRVACCEIDSATPRRALILGNATWLAKQMNLTEFMAAADELFYQRQIELWVVGKVPAHLLAKSHLRATRFLGFVEDLQPIFRSVRIGIIAEQTGGGFKLKSLDYIFHRVPIATIVGGMAGLPLTPGLDYLSFETMGELAHGVAAAIDDIERLNSLQRAAYKKCESGFDWSDRGRTLCNAIRKAMDRQPAAHTRRSAL
jgi:polysaccharide biosynthesis protein PslH